MNILKLILLIVCLLVLSGCEKKDLCASQELARRPSPDQVVDAVVVKIGCGATAGYSYRIFITPVGDKSLEDSIFLGDKIKNLNVSWNSSKTLLISYDEARIFEFRNFWQSEKIDNSQYKLSVLEQMNHETRR